MKIILSKIIILLGVFICFSGNASANEVKFLDITKLPEITENFEKPKLVGKNEFKFFGLKVYNIQLVDEERFNIKNYNTNRSFLYQNQIAIVIDYKRDFSRETLVKKTVDEIARINNINYPVILDQYQSHFQRIFSPVFAGDRKTAIFNVKSGVKLFLNGKPIGEIKDLIFAKRFMEVWLSEKSAYPKMTKEILGKDDF